MKPHLKQYSLTPIASAIDSEIDSILSQFFTKPLSSQYWPRSMRQFLERVLKTIGDRSEVWDLFSRCADQPVNSEWIHRHCDLLSQKSPCYVSVQERKVLGAVLRTFRLHRRELQLTLLPLVTSPQTTESTSPIWPDDICDITDMYRAISGRSLRRDISSFYLHVLCSILNDGEWKLKFLGSMKQTSTENERPISIEVVPHQVANVREFLDTVSSELKGKCANFLPNDLAVVTPLLSMASMKINDEAFYTSGGIGKGGTLGGIFQQNAKLYGITCQHVRRVSIPEYDLLCEPSGGYSHHSPELDCMFFELKTSSLLDGSSLMDNESLGKGSAAATLTDNSLFPSLYNLLPLKTMKENDLLCEDNEEVYKMGKQTGLTIGRLSSMGTFFKDPFTGETYEDVVEVNWVRDQSRFAAHGDCGSLYCVRRGHWFVPIAIHRASGTSTSYGSKFSIALGLLPDDDISFVNPPNFEML